MAKKTVLITGCSKGGMGYGLAQAFAEKGCHVFATARNLAKAVELTSEFANVEVVPLDVTSPESIAACVETIRAKTDGRLDILVNNAGMAEIMPALDTDIANARAQFEVNFWGAFMVTQAFSPLVIEANGTIVNISSLAAVVRLPWQSIYNASKAALSQFSETLRLEVEPLGVKVVTVQLGVVLTNLYEPIHCDLPEGSHYKPLAATFNRMSEGELNELRETPLTTGRSIVRDVLAGRTGQIWRGGLAGRTAWTWWLTPSKVLDWVSKQNKGYDQWKMT